MTTITTMNVCVCVYVRGYSATGMRMIMIHLSVMVNKSIIPCTNEKVLYSRVSVVFDVVGVDL
jgi:hypothetical protein